MKNLQLKSKPVHISNDVDELRSVTNIILALRNKDGNLAIEEIASHFKMHSMYAEKEKIDLIPS